MGKSYSKIRHIQNVNLLSETRFLNSKSLLMEGDDDCLKGDCVNGYGEFKFPDGSIYKGNFKNRLRDGYGEMKNTNGINYKGNYKKGDENGYGEKTWTDKSSHKGNFKDGHMTGYGVRVDNDGSKYEGNFKDGERDGYGEKKWKNGRFYKGYWKNNKQNGYGELTNSSGEIKYKGNFKDDIINGKGTLINKNGCKFYGDWVNGYLNDKQWVDDYFLEMTDCPENNQPSNDDEIQIGGVDEYFKGTPVDDKDPFEYLKIKKANGTEEYWFRGVKDKDNYKALTKYPNWRRSKNRIGLDAIKDQINFDERMTDVPENWENRV